MNKVKVEKLAEKLKVMLAQLTEAMDKYYEEQPNTSLLNYLCTETKYSPIIVLKFINMLELI